MKTTKRVKNVNAKWPPDFFGSPSDPRVTRVHPRPLSLPLFVNDIHSQLNRTRVARIAAPGSLEQLREEIVRARDEGRSLSVAGGRHAMGGQQFAQDSVLLDTSRLCRVLRFDAARREVEVEAGIHWPGLIEYTLRAQEGSAAPKVGIVQKQTGADRLSLGGALAANVHGRGLRLKPFVADVESFVLVGADGEARRCSRLENAQLFRLVAGGYGLFGVVYSVTLRLAPRRRLERVVRLARLSDLRGLFEERIREGFLYGDFQFATDPRSEEFLRTGIFSCYRPTGDDDPRADDAQHDHDGEHRELSPEDWRELLYLAHADRRRAFEVYASHYLATSGQLYWSDTHQLSVYLDGYHRELDARLRADAPGSEMISELYVPREKLSAFMETVRADFRRNSTELVYGTVRLIERDEETFLAWAREDYACVVFNLHVRHTPAGRARARREFRLLIDRAIECGGSYYLTYHRWATREQLLRCYPQMPDFLRHKLRHDPAELFQSDWYRHHRALLACGPRTGRTQSVEI